MDSKNSPDIVTIDVSDSSEDDPVIPLADQSSDRNIEVTLSSDSEDEIIFEEEVNNSGIVFEGLYKKTHSRRNRRNRNKRNTSENSLNLKNEVMTPSKIKSSPQSQEISSEKGLPQNTSPEQRSPIPTDTQSDITIDSQENEEMINESVGQMSLEDDSSHIEGVEDLSPPKSILKSIVNSPSKAVIDGSGEDPIPSLTALSLSPQLSHKSDACIQTEVDCSSKRANIIENVTEVLEEIQPIGEYYICCYVGCGQEFNNALLHYKHEKKHLKELKDQSIATFKCVQKGCSFAGITQSELMYHNAEHSGQYLCRNSKCIFQTQTADNLNQHMKRHSKRKRTKRNGLDCNCGEMSCRKRD